MCICICERQIIFLRKHCKCNIIRFIIYSYEQSTTIVGLIIDVNLRINSQLRLSLMIQHIHITTIQIIYTKSFKVQEHNTFRLIRYNSYCYYNEESVKINQGLSNMIKIQPKKSYIIYLKDFEIPRLRVCFVLIETERIIRNYYY